MTKHNTKLIVLCFSWLSLSLLQGFYGELPFPVASANNVLIQAESPTGELSQDDSERILIAQNTTDGTADSSDELEQTVVEEISVENANEESSEDYLIPKTVYIGVDSIASPQVTPQTATSPEPTDTDGARIDEQSTVLSETEKTSESVVETDASESTESPQQASVNESDSVTQSAPTQQSSEENNSVAAENTQEKVKAPEIQQVKTESLNSVAKRITLFKSIDVTSELDVPAGLPEDLNEDRDSPETASSADSQITQDSPSSDTQGNAPESENKLAKVEDQPEQTQEQDQAQVSDDENVVDEATQEGSADDLKKPAIVVNINDSLQIDSRNEWGWTKIMSAAIEGNLETVNELLAQGANPDIAGEDGRSPLMAASWNKHYEVVESLINAGADVNLINRDGWTALSFASWNGDLAIVRSLLRFAANKFIKTADGFTPLQLAEQKGHQQIVELLK